MGWVGRGGGGGGTGGSTGAGPIYGNLPTSGETSGIPNWLPWGPGSIWDLVLAGGTGCEFGPCVTLGDGFVATGLPGIAPLRLFPMLADFWFDPGPPRLRRGTVRTTTTVRALNTKVTPQQAADLCWVAVQLRYNGMGPVLASSGDPGLTVALGTTVYSNGRLMNPTGTAPGAVAQAGGAGAGMAVGKPAAFDACMDYYRAHP